MIPRDNEERSLRKPKCKIESGTEGLEGLETSSSGLRARWMQSSRHLAGSYLRGTSWKRSFEGRLRIKRRPELRQHTSVEVKLIEQEEDGRNEPLLDETQVRKEESEPEVQVHDLMSENEADDSKFDDG